LITRRIQYYRAQQLYADRPNAARLHGWRRPRSLAKRRTGIRAGVTPWLELGAYLPLYTITGDEWALIDGAKVRALFVSPNAAERTFWYGVNFELSYNARHWQEARYALEIRPILGWRFGPVDLLLNPIIDFPFHGGPGALTFAPADRLTYNLSRVGHLRSSTMLITAVSPTSHRLAGNIMDSSALSTIPATL
jgi:hypothetical protein